MKAAATAGPFTKCGRLTALLLLVAVQLLLVQRWDGRCWSFLSSPNCVVPRQALAHDFSDANLSQRRRVAGAYLSQHTRAFVQAWPLQSPSIVWGRTSTLLIAAAGSMPPLQEMQRGRLVMRGKRGPRSGGAAEEEEDGSDPVALTRKITSAGSAELVLDAIEPFVDTPIFNEIHIGATWTRLAHRKASLDHQGCSRLEPLIQRTGRALETHELDARQTANVFWAIAKLQDKCQQPPDLMSQLINCIEFHASSMAAQAVSNVVWGSATLPLSDDELSRIMPPLCARVCDKVDQVEAQHVANMIWAAAKLGKRTPQSLLEIVEVLSEVARERLVEMTNQDVANIIWAAATLKATAPGLLDLLPVLATQLERVLAKSVPQDVSNILWAAATVKQECPYLLDEALPFMFSAIKDCSARMTTQALSNSVWALTKLDAPSDDTAEVLRTLVEAAKLRVQQMNGQNMANNCQSFALAGVKDVPFLTEISKQVVTTSSKWSRKSKELDLPEILLGFAILGVPDHALMKVVAEEMKVSLPKALPVTLCALAFSFDELDKEGTFQNFRGLVAQQLKRRKLGPEAVSKARVGIAEWNEWYKGRTR